MHSCTAVYMYVQVYVLRCLKMSLRKGVCPKWLYTTTPTPQNTRNVINAVRT